MFRRVYAIASDLAICQRCPALFGYKIHMHEKNAWQVGIKGNGSYYGSMFHKNIAKPFFEAASDMYSPLHAEAVRAVSGSREDLEEFIRERIFMPFMEEHSGEYSPGQIMAAAKGVRVWAEAMAGFFAEIPSLRTNPRGCMSVVFLLPEQKLKARYDFPGEGELVVIGCYDALMFNPDRAEARLFEFKGYAKGDIAVPLSQSLIYAWLLWKYTGVVPSVEIIYLDEEDRKPVIFDPASVKSMMDSGLPGLFYAAFSTITLRRMPEIMKDKNLCRVCRFSSRCASDWAAKFRKRVGASLVNVCVFFLAATMITAQVFFFSTTSTETLAEEAQATARRFSMDRKLELAFTALQSPGISSAPVSGEVVFSNISDYLAAGITWGTLTSFDAAASAWSDDAQKIYIYNLNYTLKSRDVTNTYTINYGSDKAADGWGEVSIPKRLFPPMSADYFLVRVLTPAQGIGRNLMYQVLVKRNTSVSPYTVKPLAFQEVWYE